MKRIKEEYKKYYQWGLTLFISLTAVMIVSTFLGKIGIVFSWIGKIFGALSSVWIGLLIAYLLSPVVKAMEKRIFIPLFSKAIKKEEGKEKKVKGISRAISVVLSVILAIAVVAALLMLVVPQVITSIAGLATQLPDYYKNIQGFVENFAAEHPSIGGVLQDVTQGAYDKIYAWIQNDLLQSANLLGTVTDGLMSTVGAVANVFIGIIISIYLLIGKENFLMQARKLLAAACSEKMNERILAACSETHHVFGEFISGKIIDSLIVGVLTFIIIALIGIPYSVLIAVVIGVTNLIPFFGQFIGIIPTALLVFIENPVKGIIYLVVIILILQFDGNILSPKILGDSIGLGSFWILFSIIFFGGLFGFWGMLFAVPVFAMIYRWATRFTNRHLKKKGLPTESYEYRAEEKEKTSRLKFRKEKKQQDKQGEEEG